MKNSHLRKILITLIIGLLCHANASAKRNNKLKMKNFETQAEQVDVNKIKKKYWARGNQSEIGVVQNRIYSKAGRFNFGLLGGVSFLDPFLNVKHLGASVGYHFNETWGLYFTAWKNFTKGSSALDAVNQQLTVTVNTNDPRHYFGFETTASVIYGKLSIFGKSIIYYDLHLLGGLGLTRTNNGTYLTPSLGIGQRFFMSKSLALRVDYRLLFYRESIQETQITNSLGSNLFSRNAFSNSVSLGLDLFF